MWGFLENRFPSPHSPSVGWEQPWHLLYVDGEIAGLCQQNSGVSGCGVHLVSASGCEVKVCPIHLRKF